MEIKSAIKEIKSATKKITSKITEDYINIAVLACSLILDVATLSLDNFWVTLAAVSGTLLYCASVYCERERYYMVYYHYDNGAGAQSFSIRGELDIKEARKFLILREKKNIVIGYWKEISAKQFNDFCDYDWDALLRDVSNMTCEYDIIDKHKDDGQQSNKEE